MSFSYVNSGQKTSTAGVTSLAYTLAWTPTAGDLLVVGAATANAMGSPSCADSLSNAWTQVGAVFHDSGNLIFGSFYYSILANVGAGMVVTWSQANTQIASIGVAGFTPSATPSTDGSSTNSAASGQPYTSGSFTTAGPSDLVIGFAATKTGNATFTAGTGCTLIQSSAFVAGNHAGFAMEYQVGVAAGAQNPSIGNGASTANWAMIGAAFTAAGGAVFVPAHLIHRGLNFTPLDTP